MGKGKVVGVSIAIIVGIFVLSTIIFSSQNNEFFISEKMTETKMVEELETKVPEKSGKEISIEFEELIGLKQP